MLIDPNTNAVVPELLRDGVFEQAETELIRTILKPGDTFIDIGGNIGYYTLIAANIVKDSGKVIAFEPEPKNFAILNNNVELNNFYNVTLIPKALSDKRGHFKLFLNRLNTGAHHLYDTGDGSEFLNVEVTTLDEYLYANPSKVDVIKMDIEGYEPFAFRGMKNTIKMNPNIKILSEFSPEMIMKAGDTPLDYIKDLRSLGFIINIIDEHEHLISNISDGYLFDYCKINYPVNLFCVRQNKTA
ncbi:MAG: FkbM family methyltransferase [Bacteroidota bacterium]|nr:FkbM family methyltransferase [Bacteroidota bacterium]